MRKVSKNPFAGKEMQYITDQHKDMKSHEEDAYLVTPSLPKQRLLFGEPIELEGWEVERWDKFQKWISEKGLKPLSDLFTSETRLGFQLMYFYGFDKPGAPDEEIF